MNRKNLPREKKGGDFTKSMSWLENTFKRSKHPLPLGDFLEWLGESDLAKVEVLFSIDDVRDLPVIERLGITFAEYMCGDPNKKKQVMVRVGVDTTFFRVGAFFTGNSDFSSGEAAIRALLSLWDLEVWRKVDVVRKVLSLPEKKRHPFVNFDNAFDRSYL